MSKARQEYVVGWLKYDQAESKYNEFRFRWLQAMMIRKMIPESYAANELGQFPKQAWKDWQ